MSFESISPEILYYLIATLVMAYCLIDLPTANLTDGQNIVSSVVISAVVGWFAWPVSVYMWLTIRKDRACIKKYLQDRQDPRHKDYHDE